MASIRITRARVALLCALAAWLVCCEGGDGSGATYCQDHSEYNYFTVLTRGEGCDHTFEACDSCERGASCQDAITLTFTDYQSGICTIPCSADPDCSGMSLNSDFDHTSETWTCAGGYCTVTASKEVTPLSACERCRRTCAGQGSWCSCTAECG